MIAQVVVAALGIVAQVAPGLLAAWTGAPTDEEAIETARGLVAALPIARSADDADLAERIAGGLRAGADEGPPDPELPSLDIDEEGDR